MNGNALKLSYGFRGKNRCRAESPNSRNLWVSLAFEAECQERLMLVSSPLSDETKREVR
jgi:hypothetical protein